MQLVVQSGAEPGRVYDLTEGSLSVGRQSVNEVVVNDEQVSRKHARIDVTSQGIVLTDNNSANGTFVNGTRISTPQVLKIGDTIQFGTTILKVVDSNINSATVPTGMEQPAPSSYTPSSAYQSSPPNSPLSQASPQPFAATSQPQPSSPAYGYGQPQTDYAQPQANYGQQPGYGQQAGYAPQDYGQQQVAAYGQQQPQAPQVAPAKKGGVNPLFFILGGVVALVVIVALLFVFVFSGAGGVGELPTPQNSSKLDIPSSEFRQALGPAGASADKLKIGFFKTGNSGSSVIDFYNTEMPKKGWKLETSGSNATTSVFSKGDQIAAASISQIADNDSLNDVLRFFPSLKDKVKVGDTVVTLLSGSQADLRTLFGT